MQVIDIPIDTRYVEVNSPYVVAQRIARLGLDVEQLKRERETEHKRVKQARKEAQEMKGKTHPTLGKPVATIPAREFFRLTKKYGHETVHSKEFLKYYNKKFPELSPNKA